MHWVSCPSRSVIITMPKLKDITECRVKREKCIGPIWNDSVTYGVSCLDAKFRQATNICMVFFQDWKIYTGWYIMLRIFDLMLAKGTKNQPSALKRHMQDKCQTQSKPTLWRKNRSLSLKEWLKTEVHLTDGVQMKRVNL